MLESQIPFGCAIAVLAKFLGHGYGCRVLQLLINKHYPDQVAERRQEINEVLHRADDEAREQRGSTIRSFLNQGPLPLILQHKHFNMVSQPSGECKLFFCFRPSSRHTRCQGLPGETDELYFEGASYMRLCESLRTNGVSAILLTTDDHPRKCCRRRPQSEGRQPFGDETREKIGPSERSSERESNVGSPGVDERATDCSTVHYRDMKSSRELDSPREATNNAGANDESRKSEINHESSDEEDFCVKRLMQEESFTSRSTREQTSSDGGNAEKCSSTEKTYESGKANAKAKVCAKGKCCITGKMALLLRVLSVAHQSEGNQLVQCLWENIPLYQGEERNSQVANSTDYELAGSFQGPVMQDTGRTQGEPSAGESPYSSSGRRTSETHWHEAGEFDVDMRESSEVGAPPRSQPYWLPTRLYRQRKRFPGKNACLRRHLVD